MQWQYILEVEEISVLGAVIKERGCVDVPKI